MINVDRTRVQVPYPEHLLHAAQQMGLLMEYWGFKQIHGGLWAILYLDEESLSQKTLQEITGYSKGAISMALGELMEWGVVCVERPFGGKGRKYRAETDLAAMIRTVLVRREKPMLELALKAFKRAREVESTESNPTFRKNRLLVLVGLTEAALWTLDRFVRTGGLPFIRLRKYMEKGLAVIEGAR